MTGMIVRKAAWRLPFLLGLCALMLTGCANKTLNRAPVEDRAILRPAAPGVNTNTAIKPMPGIENAGKTGFYTVKPGDTLIRIGLDTGQNWRDIARWNSLDKPNQIEVGQVLRVIPPVVAAAAASSGSLPSPAASTGVVTRPVTSGSATPVLPASSASPTVASPSSASSAVTRPAAEAAVADDEISWAWPVTGSILAGFDEVKNKGLDLGGAAGDAVLAAADGRVVYAGSGLRGYGNLIILKHNNTYLTAYAHNQALLVKEDQSVRKGQKIAEMGNSDSDRVKLHFEVRRQGKPVDPVKYLPAR